MKKQRVKRKATKKKEEFRVPVAKVIYDLTLWEFSKDEKVIYRNASEIGKAILLSYGLHNFGPNSFGLKDDEENGDT